MSKVKIAFFDIDSTLIDMERETMTEQMEETLLRLQKNNIIICIATGRPPKSVPQFSRVQFDAFLTNNRQKSPISATISRWWDEYSHFPLSFTQDKHD